MLWLRRSFIAGFFVTVPLFISVATILWLFRVVDGLVGPLYIKLLGPDLVPPGLGIATTALAILLVGAIATNVVGKRLLQRARVAAAPRAALPQRLCARSSSSSWRFRRITSTASSAWF